MEIQAGVLVGIEQLHGRHILPGHRRPHDPLLVQRYARQAGLWRHGGIAG